MRRSFVLAFLALALLLGVSGFAAASDANGNHDSYIWFVGEPPGADTAIAPDGSTITMQGSGTFKAGPGKTATGGGTYSLSSGGSGSWVVTGVQGFVFYGETAAPGLPPGSAGGEVKLDVTLSKGASGVLTIYCILGSPPAGKEEGITLILGRDGQFTKQAGGNTLFIRL